MDNGGPGIGLLFTLSMKNIMIRWCNYVVDLAVLKLKPIVDRMAIDYPSVAEEIIKINPDLDTR